MLIKTHSILGGLSWRLQVMFFKSLTGHTSSSVYRTKTLFDWQTVFITIARHANFSNNESLAGRLHGTISYAQGANDSFKIKKKTHLKFKILTILNEITSTSGVRSLDSNSHFHLSRGNTMSHVAHVLVQALCSALTSTIQQVHWAQGMHSYVHFP